MARPVSEHVQKGREAVRATGLRPVKIGVPDAWHSGFAAECRRQSALIADSDRSDTDLSDFMDAALDDIDEWQRAGAIL